MSGEDEDEVRNFTDFYDKILFEYDQPNDIPTKLHHLQEIGVNIFQSSVQL